MTPRTAPIATLPEEVLPTAKYEHPLYQRFQESAPPVGSRVSAPEGDGRVVGHSVPRDSVTVRLDADGSRCSCSRASVCAPRQAHDQHYTP